MGWESGLDLDAFEKLALRRRSVRDFRSDPIADELLERLLNVARWAPSGYNLQPTHFVVVRDAERKQRLYQAAMSQRQILAAPATVVFAGDRDVAAHNFERMLASERAAGTLDPKYEALLRKYVPLAFERGPLGWGRWWKGWLPSLLRLTRPVPAFPAAEMRYWLGKQVLLSAMQFMLAADAAGLATVPMEGFDEGRVRRVLGMPARMVVCLLVPVGRAANSDLNKTRLPLESMVHHDGW